MSLHDLVIELLALFKYIEDKEGQCFGITMRWIEACIANEDALFVARFDKIVFYGMQLPSLIDKIKNKRKTPLTSTDKELMDILAFLESVVIYQSPSEYGSLFNNEARIAQENIEATSTFASSDKILAQGGLATLYKQPIIYNQKELINYLDNLKKLIESSTLKNSLVIKFSAANHSAALSYRNGIGWRFMDINQYSYKDFGPQSTTKTVESLQNLFNQHEDPNKSFLAVNMSIIGTKKSLVTARIELTDKLKQFKIKYPITKELAARESNGINLISLAAMLGDVELIAQLITLKSNINLTYKGMPPIFMAAQDGHVAAVVALAKSGAKLDIVSNDGATSVCIAVQEGYAEVVEELAKYGADLNQMYEGVSLACIAAQEGNAAVIAVLAKYGVDLNQKGVNGNTLACIAARHGHAAVIAVLVKCGVNLNQANNNGATPVSFAARCGQRAIISVLAKYGANLNQAQNDSATPVFIAAQCGHKTVITELEKNGADLNKLFISTPDQLIKFASTHSLSVQKKMSNFIKNQGATRTHIHMKPRDIAYIMGHTPVVKLLDEYVIIRQQEKVFRKLLTQMEQLLLLIKIKRRENPIKYNQALLATTKLYTTFKEQGTVFYKTPTPQTFAQFKSACNWEEAKINIRGYSKEWEQLHYIIKAVLGLLAALSLIPMLVIEINTQQGYWGMFFTPITPPVLAAFEDIKKPLEESSHNLEAVLTV